MSSGGEPNLIRTSLVRTSSALVRMCHTSSTEEMAQKDIDHADEIARKDREHANGSNNYDGFI